MHLSWINLHISEEGGLDLGKNLGKYLGKKTWEVGGRGGGGGTLPTALKKEYKIGYGDQLVGQCCYLHISRSSNGF